jgi:putative FmdB family regulatory protein
MPTYDYECRKCGCRFDSMESVENRDTAHCPDCDGPAKRLVSLPAMVVGDVYDWSAENKGKGRRISQLDHGVRKPYYATSRQKAIDEAHKRGLNVIKT